MVEVNIPEQEPEPDIRPSSRPSTTNTHSNTTQQAQAQAPTQDKSVDASDEHAVRRSPDIISADAATRATSHQVDQDHHHDRSSSSSATTLAAPLPTHNQTHHDVSARPYVSRSDAVDVPPAQKGDSQAPMRSILQGVTSRFTSYPNQHNRKNIINATGGNASNGYTISKSSPDLSRVDEKDHASFMSSSTDPAHSTSPLYPAHNVGYSTGPFGFKRQHLHKSSSAPKNDLHSRFNLLRDPSPLGAAGRAGDLDEKHVNFNTNTPLNNPGVHAQSGMTSAAAGGAGEVLPDPSDPLAQGTGGIGLIGPIRPTKSMAELLVPARKLGTDPTWSESLRNTVKCES